MADNADLDSDVKLEALKLAVQVMSEKYKDSNDRNLTGKILQAERAIQNIELDRTRTELGIAKAMLMILPDATRYSLARTPIDALNLMQSENKQKKEQSTTDQ